MFDSTCSCLKKSNEPTAGQCFIPLSTKLHSHRAYHGLWTILQYIVQGEKHWRSEWLEINQQDRLWLQWPLPLLSVGPTIRTFAKRFHELWSWIYHRYSQCPPPPIWAVPVPQPLIQLHWLENLSAAEMVEQLGLRSFLGHNRFPRPICLGIFVYQCPQCTNHL